MITTRAREGISVILLDVLEQVFEASGGETTGRALEPFHGPGPEVVIEGARGVLDRAPQRPPVHAHQAEEPGPGDHAPPRPAVVGRDELGQRVIGQVRLGPDVAELEAGVVVTGQLVVDQPDPVPVVDDALAELVTAYYGRPRR